MIRLINYKKTFPNLQGGKAFSRWFWVDTFFNGKLIHISVKHYTLEFDFRLQVIYNVKKVQYIADNTDLENLEMEITS